jgi:arginine decarboxylase
LPVFGPAGQEQFMRVAKTLNDRADDKRVEQTSAAGDGSGPMINPWPTPNRLWLSAGAAEGTTELNAFDNALLDAGIGNLNLIKVSSIVPQGAEFLQAPPVITPGSLVPTVYSVMHSDTAGETICAALGIGIGRDSHGMIFEYHANSREVAERVVRGMVEEGFARRRLPLERVTVTLAEHRVERLGCAVAAVVLWWG